VETEDITLALPRALLEKVKAVAAERETSVSALLAASLQEIVRNHDDPAAVQRAGARVRKGYDLGSGGRLRAGRDELHER
jgi:hypothetical protein